MFHTAFSLSQQQERKKCSTGITQLDDLIGGGFEPGLSYLIYGSPSCTSLLQQSVASALRRITSKQGVVVIDANNGIRPNIILAYLRALSQSAHPAVHLNRLHVARAFTVDQLLSLLDTAANTIESQRAPILFLNGFTHLLQQEEEGARPLQRGTPSDPRVFHRAQVAAYLKQIAFTQQVAVVVSADAPKHLSQPPLRLGQVAYHLFHVLIHHSRHNNLETFTLEKHPSRPWLQRRSVVSRSHRPLRPHQQFLFEEEDRPK